MLGRSSNSACHRATFLAVLIAVTLGCSESDPQFAMNQALIARYQIELGESIPGEQLSGVQQSLDLLFGSPDSPRLLDSLPSDLISQENLRRAAGAVSSDEHDTHYGLYRKHCVRCHGLTGDGRGPAAKLLAPYPRDFRLGRFKFKSTPLGIKPTRQDLAKILRAGIPGTSMPSFKLLKDEDIDALVDYIIYLSVRGETERALLHDAAFTMNNDSEVRLPQQLDELARQYFDRWHVAPQSEPKPPQGYPVWVLKDGASHLSPSDISESIERGRKLFQDKVTNCWLCHGQRGEGRVEFKDYDDWTKDLFAAAGIDPEDRSAISPIVKAGAFKPVPISARNLEKGVFRGGNSPSDVYLRIVHGIEGTPMPAAALARDVQGGLTEEQVWDLVNYCLSFQSGAHAAHASGDANPKIEMSHGER